MGRRRPAARSASRRCTLQVTGRYFDVEDFLYRLEEYVAFRNASFRVTGRLLQVTHARPDGFRRLRPRADSPPLAVTIGLNAYLWGAWHKRGGRWRCAMSQNRRVLTYVAIALIVGAALALAVALSNSGAGTSGVTARPSGENAMRHRSSTSDSSGAALAAADPAKEQPLLDKFTSKDPFIPFPTPGATSTATPSPNPTSTSAPSNLFGRRSRWTGRPTT